MPDDDLPTDYVGRTVDLELDELLPQLPAVLLDGPKAVGKTATALRRAATVRRLDDPAQLAIAQASPELVVEGARPVLVDEWQRHEPVWDVVRRAVDAGASPGSFLLTGSGPRGGTHSGAGRIVSLRMRPMCFEERRVAMPTVRFRDFCSGHLPDVRGASPVGLADYVDEILTGGFPGLRRYTGRALSVHLDGYVQRIVDRDLSDSGFAVRRPATVLAWLRAYAAATSTTASWESIRDAATAGTSNKPARSTTIPYVEVLSALRVLDELPAWSPSRNHLARVAASPKHHLADPALAAHLLGQTKDQLLTSGGTVATPNDGPLLGNLFESLVALSVRTYAQALGGTVHHLRTDGGRHEVDFVVELGHGVLAVEATASSTVGDRDVRHLRWLRDRLGDRLLDAVVVSTGPEAYRRSDGIAVVPLALLGY